MSWLDLPKPLIILAPMDGYTTPPFRRFIKKVAPHSIVFSEFLSAALVHKKPSLAEKMFANWPDEAPVVIQLYGKDVEDFRVAAMLAEEKGAAGVDINMGCPAKKVVAHRHGSALMKEIDLACDIIAGMKKAISVPVTVKTRLGWENHDNLIPFAKRLEDHGLDAITIHGRTYHQKFEGEAYWEPIYDLKDSLSIPVFGNGDITTVEEAKARLGNLDGVMVGRGAVSDPWVMEQCVDFFHKGPEHVKVRPFSEKAPYWKNFAAMAVATGSELHACQAFRKYLVRLIKDLGLETDYRKMAVRVETLEQINEVLDRFVDASEKSCILPA